MPAALTITPARNVSTWGRPKPNGYPGQAVVPAEQSWGKAAHCASGGSWLYGPERRESEPASRAAGGEARVLRAGRKFRGIQRVAMSSTFDTVANIIAETCDIPRDQLKPESHAIDDLGIDSLDFLDIAFAIDKAFGIKLPLEEWTQEVNDGKATTDQYFVLGNLCTQIDSLVAAKGA
jgi:acyl carrier protein